MMLKELFQRFKWMIVLASCLSTLSAFAGISMLSMITDVIGALQSGKLEAAYSFGVFVLAVLVVMFAGVISQFILLRMSSISVYEIQKTLLQRILSTNYEKIERIGGHRIMATMQRDVSILARGLMLMPTFIYSSVTVFLCMAYMLYTSWQLFFFVVLAVSLIIVAAKTTLHFAMSHQSLLREYVDAFFANLQALTNGGKEINLNSNRRRHFYHLVMLPLFQSIQKKTVKSELLFVSAESFTGTLIFFLIGSIVYGAHYFLHGVATEVVVAFVLVVLYMVDPLKNVVSIVADVNEVRVSLNKIEKLDLSEAKNFLLPPNSDKVHKGHFNKITLDNICFQYRDRDLEEGYVFSIGPISAELKAGEIAFVTGGNGSGKSTFAKLLVGLYDLDSGSIYLDDKLVGTDLSLEQYKNNISVIFSDFFIFHQLLDNEGEPASDDVVISLLQLLQLDGKVSSKNGLLSSTDLSQGQRKRLALLQSSLCDASICVYDEWAAEQDPKFKDYFYNNLLPQLKALGKIIIIISHDEHYFHKADQILKFEEGLLVAS